VVVIAFQNDVKEAFSKVKADILNLKRSVNRELVAIDELGSRLQTTTSKDEFYKFIKRLGERLDRIEASLQLYSGYEEDIKDVETKVKVVGKKLSRQEDLSSEIKEVRKLKGKLKELEGTTVNVNHFNIELSKLLSEISSVKKIMLTDEMFRHTESKLVNTNQRIENLKKVIPSRQELSDNIQALTDLKQSFEKSEDVKKKKFNEISNTIKNEVENLQESFVDKDSFQKRANETGKELNSLKKLFDNSVSEVDFSSYATKKELTKNLVQIDDINSEIKKMSGDVSNFDERLTSLTKHAASVDDVNRIGSDVKSISKSIDSLKVGIEKVAEVSQKRFDQAIDKTNEKFEKQISKLRSEIAEKSKRPIKDDDSVKSGLIPKVGKGIADFFKEEEEPPKKEEKKAKSVWSVSEFLKDEEKKKGKKKDVKLTGLLIGGAIALLVILVGAYYYFTLGDGEILLPPETNGDIEEITDVEEDQLVEEPEMVPEEEIIETIVEPPPEDEASSEAIESEINESDTPPEIEEDVIVVVDENGEPIDTDTQTCMQQYDCKAKAPGEYWFDCGVDVEGTCRCFVTNAEGCGIVETPSDDIAVQEVGAQGATLRNNVSYLVAAAVILIVMIIIYMITSKGPEPKSKPKKKEEGEDSVDLEEFFDKKESKK